MYGEVKLKDEHAKEINALACEAIEKLTQILNINQEYEEYAQVKKGVGMAIGYIDTNILQAVYRHFPELDTIK
jgi:hypothetical protein